MKYASLDLGTIEAVFNKLGGVEGARKFLAPEACVAKKHVIDLTARDGDIKYEWDNGASPRFEWNPVMIGLHHLPVLKPLHMPGDSFAKHRELVMSRRWLNRNVLWYLYKNPEIIPVDWIGKNVLFLGTGIWIGETLEVPYLYFHGTWRMSAKPLWQNHFGDDDFGVFEHHRIPALYRRY